jgi:nucleotide-binding universal stress UspA family protein
MTGRTEQVRRVVVGLDGSANSRAALDYVVALARPLGAEVVAVYALMPLEYVYPPHPLALPVQFDEEALRTMQGQLEDEWCRPLRDAGVRYRARVVTGRPSTVLEDTAREEGADLIVVGRRGRSAARELLAGSVSHELSHRSEIPVLIVNLDREAAEKAS